MDALRLTAPSVDYLDQIAAYRQEFLDAGSSMDGCGSLREIAGPVQWLKKIESYSHMETLPEGRVLSSQFLCVREADNYLIGMIQVRHYFNDYLAKYGGHIGYSVRPSERRKGYAKRMLQDLLPYCRSIGLERVLITCIADNEASRRTILSNGGVYESTVYSPEEEISLERYWIALLP